MNIGAADTRSSEMFCACLTFTPWYAEGDVEVCDCGHPRAYHTHLTGTCLGDVRITRGGSTC